MVPVLLAAQPVVARHHPLGVSTGCLRAARGDWEQLVELALATGSFAVELSALSERELPDLLAFLGEDPALPFRYLSVHAPTKQRRMDEADLVAELGNLVGLVDAIVVHPDVIEDPALYTALGDSLVIENMDARKSTGRTAAELARLFARLPEAGFCLDVAHVASIDPTLAEGEHLLDRFGPRLRHLHVSSLDSDGDHVSITVEDEARFAAMLARCRDVPWILEAPLRPEG